MINRTKTFALAATTIFLSCNKHDCHNTNTVLDSAEPQSATYKKELAAALKTDQKLTYIFTEYEEINNIPQLHIDIHSEKLCAKTTVAVTQPNETLKIILDNKGTGYQGAELEDLKIHLDTVKNEFVFDDLRDIID